MNHSHDQRARYVLGLAILLACTMAHALSTDVRQAIHVEANHANIDQKTGTSTYTGKVTITQGSLRISANEITVQLQKGKLQKIIATGTPATYRQRPDNKETDIIANANEIEYQADRNIAIFTRDASLQQGGNIFKSDHIVYNIGKNKVDAGKSGGGDRVTITIQPPTDKPNESKQP